MIHYFTLAAASLLVIALTDVSAVAQDTAELGKQSSNPIASLSSVPSQGNFDFGGGADDQGFAFTMNVRPVVPVPVYENWGLISRTIAPLAYRDFSPAPGNSCSGIGDFPQGFFFSPNANRNGVTCGVGPVFLLPTATDCGLGSSKSGTGPAGVVLQQDGPRTYGALANHIWSAAGDDDRADVNQTYFQPSGSDGQGQTISFRLDSSHYRETEQLNLPVNVGYSKISRAGVQPMSFQIGARHFIGPPAGVSEWGIRTGVTSLLPYGITTRASRWPGHRNHRRDCDTSRPIGET